MNSGDIQSHIEELVAEEHRLFDASQAAPLDEAARRRLNEVNVELDRYYDLLRQRRARDEFGQDPHNAHLRSGDTVEKYLQ
ncbi:MAG: DUF2630 family protein [Candidatus Eremiobacteraeota bacterium]|nr:DUF2630 family protein [Candidatus Eremiobacteraeota bacterium]